MAKENNEEVINAVTFNFNQKFYKSLKSFENKVGSIESVKKEFSLYGNTILNEDLVVEIEETMDLIKDYIILFEKDWELEHLESRRFILQEKLKDLYENQRITEAKQFIFKENEHKENDK
ncbi:hypothetical protein ACKXGF_07395 [Alkalibacillus sp. S2W]|uniref:hypothetical protein n=1 Tax=Alkalibacillus sp. S2W TaxID=3386553 RepID=UPI00398D0CF4